MSEYNFSDYGIFGDAISLTSELNSTLSNENDAIDECKSKLSDESILCGPLANECSNNISKIVTELSNIINNFSKLSSNLETIATNYSNGDKNASIQVTSVDFGTKL